MYVLWKLFNNPDEKVLIVSASLSRAEAMSAWLLKTIGDVPWLRHMLPDSHDGRYSRIAFDVGTCKHIEQSPSVRAAGGSGPNYWVEGEHDFMRRPGDTYNGFDSSSKGKVTQYLE